KIKEIEELNLIEQHVEVKVQKEKESDLMKKYGVYHEKIIRITSEFLYEIEHIEAWYDGYFQEYVLKDEKIQHDWYLKDLIKRNLDDNIRLLALYGIEIEGKINEDIPFDLETWMKMLREYLEPRIQSAYEKKYEDLKPDEPEEEYKPTIKHYIKTQFENAWRFLHGLHPSTYSQQVRDLRGIKL
ncbi:MAG: hypothetical protein ACFFCS_25565, partial [Candidatus Hodarchaeota archaeon]